MSFFYRKHNLKAQKNSGKLIAQFQVIKISMCSKFHESVLTNKEVSITRFYAAEYFSTKWSSSDLPEIEFLDQFWKVHFISAINRWRLIWFRAKLLFIPFVKKYFSNLGAYHFKTIQDTDFRFIALNSLELPGWNK